MTAPTPGVVARLREKVSAARRNPTVLRDGRPVVTIDCDEATALLAVAEAAALAAEDIGQCADPGLSPGAICRGLFPDNPEEWCGICALRDALAALNDPTREDT